METIYMLPLKSLWLSPKNLLFLRVFPQKHVTMFLTRDPGSYTGETFGRPLTFIHFHPKLPGFSHFIAHLLLRKQVPKVRTELNKTPDFSIKINKCSSKSHITNQEYSYQVWDKGTVGVSCIQKSNNYS